MILNTNIKYQGFTLIEMAIVLIILGFILATLLLPLRAQRERAAQLQTVNTLDIAKQALIGFAQTNGRLPCPATDNSTGAFPDGTGTSNPNGSGVCTQQLGFLPATTLGIQPTDAQGFLIDAWNNRIRYAITTANGSAFTTNGGMDNLGIAALTPDLRVCASVASCTSTINLTSTAAAVIYSIGATGAQAAGSADEVENLNAVANVDKIFVSHDISAAPNEFDHMVTWISPYILYNAMIQAGQLH